MVFVDDLAYGLFSLGIAGFLVLYLVTSVYLAYRNRQKDYSEILDASYPVLLLVGAYMLVSGAFGEFAWPLPGSYNILFYDPLVSFGLILVALALSIRCRTRYEFVGFFGLMAGLMTIFYGIQGYAIGLTESPIALLGLYTLFGAAGVLSYPVSLLMQRLTSSQKSVGAAWRLCLALFFLALLGGSLLAVYIGALAIPAHLLSPP